jgi:hypothetical protein
MPLSFPASPTVGQTHSANSRTWTWTGYVWEIASSGDDARWEYFKPAAPTGVTGVAGNAQAVVSWTAPAIALPPITDYSVQFSTNGGSTWTQASDAVSTGTSATITSLTNGVAHVFRVAGINGIGTGAYSTQSAAVTPALGDPFFSSVSLLLHGDGNLTNSSSYAKNVSTTGSVSTAGAARFGSASIAFSGSGRLVVPSDSTLTFNGDFTIEFFIRFTSVPSAYNWMFSQSSGGNTQMFLTTKANGSGLRWGLSNVAEYASGDFAWVPGNWYHIAVRRASNAVTIWVDGANITSGSPTNSTTFSGGFDLFGGSNLGGLAADLNGLVDEFRITNGVARNPITVPTAAFPDYA